MLRIVPKGLRSFDVHDADFFLELLPGPRDRDGLPDSLRFWKTRIEERDADATFAVGLICGPSGCGKSSLVKAGLLPRLSESVIAVYVEATAAESETRLLNGLRKRCPGLADKLNLHETLAALRRGQGVPTGRKVLIVFDQFEQWLHAKKEEQNTELVQALRQCDGGRLQCIVMVRDDFWMAVIRFMRELEVRLLEGQNSAAIDLFDTDHARKVLAAFGRAFGKLPEQSGQLSKEQREFLTQAVAGLANESKVISIRLALFAEMMKGKAWTPASLKEVGGTEGVGVAFLEETFSAATAPPERRYHQRAARGVLKALLPESGSDIKGHMRSHAELLEASGYTRRPTDFDDLLSILDSEIRLITPTDPEGEGQEHASTALPGQKYYQLTHDYLVHSLRDWLNRKQKETRRGRAELLLADRASVWNARPENRQLPSLWQWLSVRWLTERKNWSPSEQAMMRRATHFHAFRGGVLVACLLILALLGWEGNGRLKARTLRDRLLEASTSEAPAIVQEMAPYRRWVDPLLRESYDRATEQNDARKQLHASIALLPVDATQATYLLERLLTSDPQELKVIRDVLADRAGELTDRLWVVLENPQTDRDRRLRAASALAAFAPENERWVRVTNDVAAILMIQKPFAIAAWTDTLKGAGRWLIPPLARFLVDENRSIVERGLIASVYGEIAREVPDAYARLESQLAEPRGPDATAYAKKQASLGVALLIMGHGEKVWPLLKHSSDPTVRSFLIDRLAPGGVDPKVLIARLSAETEVSIRRAILQSLGEYGLDRMSPAERRNTLPQLAELYRNDPDPGIHAAAELLARQWGALAQLRSIDASFTTWKVEGQRRWYLNRQGQTMVVIPKPGEFWMGGDKEGVGEQRHRRVIDRSFAIASKEVTIDQFRQFREEHPYNRWFARTGDCPAINVLWYDAAAYCNWLSEREGLPKEQWCYLPNAEGRYAEGMTTAPDYLKRTGYRLPTEAEWEYACRAGAATEYSFGESVELLGKYGWYDGSSIGTGHPVGSRRPNDLGLFDLHGNVWEWCQDIFRAYPKDPLILDDVKSPPARDMIGHVLRGGSFNNPPTLSRSANRNNFGPATQDDAIGVRPARTVVP